MIRVWTAPNLSRYDLMILDQAWTSPVLNYSLAERIEEGRQHNAMATRNPAVQPKQTYPKGRT